MELDRMVPENFIKYLMLHPEYAKEVFGYIPTEEELKEFVDNNPNLFYDSGDRLAVRRRMK